MGNQWRLHRQNQMQHHLYQGRRYAGWSHSFSQSILIEVLFDFESRHPSLFEAQITRQWLSQVWRHCCHTWLTLNFILLISVCSDASISTWYEGELSKAFINGNSTRSFYPDLIHLCMIWRKHTIVDSGIEMSSQPSSRNDLQTKFILMILMFKNLLTILKK